MNAKRQLLSFVCLCLVSCLVGCRTDGAQPGAVPTVNTTVPATTMPQETTVPEPDPAQLYLDGILALGTDAVAMEMVCEQTMTLAGQSFALDINQTVSYWNLQSADLVALVTQTHDFGNHAFTLTETFYDGCLYQELNYCYYKAEMDAETVGKRYPGIQLFDPALYEVSLVNDSTLLLENATGLETWVVDEEGELISAQATVTLSGEGAVTGCTYNVEYTYGPATYSEVYTVTYMKPGRQPIAPEKADRYTQLTSIDGMWLLDAAYCYIQQAKQYSTEKTSSIQSQIAGCVLNMSYDLNVMPSVGNTNDYRLVTSAYLMDHKGSTQHTNDEKYIAGQYSSVVDDGRPTYNNAVTEVMINSFCQNLLLEDIVQTDMFMDANITDLGSLLLVEYTCSDEMGEYMSDGVCADLFGSAGFLDDYVSGYKTNVMSYYLSVDKYTLLPVALGYYFEGCYTLEGQELIQIKQVTQKFDLATLTAFESIHEKPGSDQKPDVLPTPLFYRVTGTQGQEMWLLGTIHVGDDRTGFLPQEIYDALDDSVALVLECDSDAFDEQLKKDEKLQEQVSDCYHYKDGTIGEHLDTEKLYEHAVMVMKATGNYNHNAEYLKAGTWSNTIDNFYLSQGHRLSSEKGVERRLIAFANENNIPIWEAESSMFQLQMLTGYSDELQEFQLYSTVYNHGRSSWEGAEELYEMWLKGNEEELTKEMERTPWGWSAEDFADMESYTEEEKERAQNILDNLDAINAQVQKLQDEYIKAMETDRNAGMLEVAKGYLESGDTVFFAVGLAHLLAEDGLVFALRDAGYTVELVAYADPA